VVQTLVVTDHIDSLAEAETQFGLVRTDNPLFFPEWSSGLPELSAAEQQRLDLTKQRYLYHQQYGHLLEGAVNFIVISPLLEMAGLYDPPFHLRSEASIRLELKDEEDKIYQGRIDSLIVQEYFWIVLVESKRTSFSVDVALPHAIASMAANLDPKPNIPSLAHFRFGSPQELMKSKNRRDKLKRGIFSHSTM
jgi:hypothetical protein